MVNQLAQFSPLDAATYVQQQGEMGRQRGQQNKLAQLASQSYSAPADQQSQLLGQMAAIDPRAAQSQQQQFESAEDRRNKTLANMSNLLVNAPEQARPGLYQQMLPTLKQFGVDAPAAYDATTAPVIDQTARALYTAYSGAAGQTPTDVRSFQMMTAGLSPEDRERARRVELGLEGRASNAGFGFELVAGPDGKQRLQRRNPRTGAVEQYDENSGDFIPMGGTVGGMQPASGTVFRTSTGELFDVSKVTEPAVRAAIMANPSEYGMLPDGASAQLPDRSVSPEMFVGRSKEQEAGAVTRAQEAAKMPYTAQEIGMRTDAAIRQAGAEATIRTGANLDQARGEAQIKNDANRATTQQQNAVAGNLWSTALGNLKKSLGGTETGPLVGRLPAVTSGQQIADGAVSQMAPVLKQLFRQAGEGTFTDRDQDLLIAMLPTRTDTPASAAAKMDAVDAMVQAKLQPLPLTAVPGPRAQATGGVDDLLSKYGIR